MAVTLRSFAKINLGLAIGSSRPDGYHALATVYQTIALDDLMKVVAKRERRQASHLPQTMSVCLRTLAIRHGRWWNGRWRCWGLRRRSRYILRTDLPVQVGCRFGECSGGAAGAGTGAWRRIER